MLIQCLHHAVTTAAVRRVQVRGIKADITKESVKNEREKTASKFFKMLLSRHSVFT